MLLSLRNRNHSEGCIYVHYNFCMEELLLPGESCDDVVNKLSRLRSEVLLLAGVIWAFKLISACHLMAEAFLVCVY